MSEMVPRNRVRAGDADRDLVLNVLQQAHAAGRLGVEELSERQDRALSIKFTDEIPPLVEDLPEGAHLLPAPGPAQFGVTPPVVPPWRPGVPVAGDSEQGTVTIMSGRRVDIEPGTVLWRNFAFWGGDDIYLAGAMGPGVVITLELNAIMGGHSVYVPPGVRVIDQSIAIMAGNDIHKGAQGDGSNGTLIIKGFLFWAGSDIKLDKSH